MWFVWKSIFPNTPSECAHWISHPETLNERTISHDLTQCKEVRAATRDSCLAWIFRSRTRLLQWRWLQGRWYGCLACLKSTVVALIEGWWTLILFSFVRLLKKKTFMVDNVDNILLIKSRNNLWLENFLYFFSPLCNCHN